MCLADKTESFYFFGSKVKVERSVSVRCFAWGARANVSAHILTIFLAEWFKMFPFMSGSVQSRS
jgi:hypothetical protein